MAASVTFTRPFSLKNPLQFLLQTWIHLQIHGKNGEKDSLSLLWHFFTCLLKQQHFKCPEFPKFLHQNHLSFSLRTRNHRTYRHTLFHCTSVTAWLLSAARYSDWTVTADAWRHVNFKGDTNGDLGGSWGPWSQSTDRILEIENRTCAWRSSSPAVFKLEPFRVCSGGKRPRVDSNSAFPGPVFTPLGPYYIHRSYVKFVWWRALLNF